MENNEEIKQNGLEFLKRFDISEISAKTFIHESELKRFLNLEFDNINKTKAMGFIQILQREYNIDLSDLKDQYLSYIQEHKPQEEESKPSMIMEEVQQEERTKGFFSFIFLVAAIGTIAYLINKYDLLNFSNPNDIKTAEVLDKKEVEDVKLNLEKLSQPQKPEIVKEVKKEEQVVASEVTSDDKKEKELSLNDVLATNTTTDENKQPKTKQNEKDTAEVVKTEKNDQKDDNELDLSKLNSELSTTQADENNSSDVVLTQIDEDQEKQATTNEIYIIPSHKVWVGTIDLETLQKKDFLTPKGDRVDIDGSKDQLIMIGHKFVKMYLNGELVKFKRKGPIRFKYINGELTEINRSEFNKLAKGRQW